MQSIRSRAIELAGDQANFESYGSVRVCDNAPDAKLEADAHLAIIADGLAHRLSEFDRLPGAFSRYFRGTLGQKYKRGTPNSKINLEFALFAFNTAFDKKYAEHPVVRQSLMTPLGVRTIEACKQFVALADTTRYPGQKVGPNQIDRSEFYEKPRALISNGIATVGGVVATSVLDLFNANVPANEGKHYLTQRERVVRGLAGTSLDQFVVSHFEAMNDVSIYSLARQLAIARGLPKHKNTKHATNAPHRGCPAMPDFPETPILKGGSGVSKLFLRGVELVVSANMHALRSDEPEHAILPRSGPFKFLEPHLRKVPLLDKV